MTTLDTNPPETKSSLIEGFSDDSGDESTSVKKDNRKKKIAVLTVLLLLLAALAGWYLMNRKPLSDLPGLSEGKLPHYEFSIYGTARPLGVAATATGDRIYVTASDGDRLVHVYDSKGIQTGTLKPPKSTGFAHTPIYVAINPTTQDVYVSDRIAASIYIYDSKGTYLRTFTPKGNLGRFAPLALGFAPDGTLYVSDVHDGTAKTQRIVAFAPDGTVLRSMGKPGELNFPNGIAVDSNGDIEVSDSGNGRLVIFSPYGKIMAMVNRGIGEGDLGLPKGAAVDDSGRLFVVDTTDHMVRVFTIGASGKTPVYFGSFGGEGQTDGAFEYPNGVATDKRAHIYITDRENSRVQVWGY